MPPESKPDLRLEIAHVLFIDIVGYSKLSINEQGAAVDELAQIDQLSIDTDAIGRALHAAFQKMRHAERLRGGLLRDRDG
jgi:hypothetical protein